MLITNTKSDIPLPEIMVLSALLKAQVIKMS